MRHDDVTLNEPNPYITLTNPFEAYQQSIEDLYKTNNGQLEFERLCYEIFIISESGKALYEMQKEKMLSPSNINPHDPQAQQAAFYWTALHDGMRAMYSAALAHQQRITAI